MFYLLIDIKNHVGNLLVSSVCNLPKLKSNNVSVMYMYVCTENNTAS